MWWRVYPSMVLMALVGCGWARGAQVTIENPQKLPIDEGRVELLYKMTCQEVAEKFHVRDYKKLEYALTVVLGEENERYLIDHKTGAGTIYLQKWNEKSFAGAATMLAFHHVLSDEQFRELVKRTLIRYWDASPITVPEVANRR